MNRTEIKKTENENQLIITRRFDAPLNLVWRSWTERDLLDQWWAPLPFRTKTEHLIFSEGGHWIYTMNGPLGEKEWCRADYKQIHHHEDFTMNNGFCDPEGQRTNTIPASDWEVKFLGENEKTTVEVIITFESSEALNTIVQMGFREGFTSAHGNLDQLIAYLQIVEPLEK